MKKVVLTSIVALAAELALALELATPFADNMVLQRGCSVPVWSTAEPGEMVTVSFGAPSKARQN